MKYEAGIWEKHCKRSKNAAVVRKIMGLGDFSLQSEPSGRPKTSVKNDAMKVLVEIQKNLTPIFIMDKWVIRTPGTTSANKRTNNDKESQNSELNAPSKKIRKYNEEFIKYGFTFCVVDDEEQTICVTYNEKLAN
ncbi:hypothetical protein TNCV_2427511 [Trichonephila clavipes]|nr:hypothetical protein TNCV_2427511 [Trichonephila clavipes]